MSFYYNSQHFAWENYRESQLVIFAVFLCLFYLAHNADEIFCDQYSILALFQNIIYLPAFIYIYCMSFHVLCRPKACTRKNKIPIDWTAFLENFISKNRSGNVSKSIYITCLTILFLRISCHRSLSFYCSHSKVWNIKNGFIVHAQRRKNSKEEVIDLVR